MSPCSRSIAVLAGLMLALLSSSELSAQAPGGTPGPEEGPSPPVPGGRAGPGLRAHLGGDVKGFFFSVFPYELEWPAGFPNLLPSEPIGQAVADLRLKLDVRYADWLRLDVHHQLTASTSSAFDSLDVSAEEEPPGVFGFAPQGRRDVPQAVDLSWTAAEGPGHLVAGRVDRMAARFRTARFHFTAGRQPITFGRAYFFTPLDLVAPFSPVVVDREYKPGVDALRVDWFFGLAGQVTATAAYAGGWGTEDLIFAGRAGDTFGGWDLALFAAAVHRDAVLGLESSGAIGPAGVRAEGTLTFPSGDESPFVRATLGADHMMAAGRLYLLGELHLQTVGADRPEEYLRVATMDRFLRGEAWALGRYYAAGSATYDLTPLVDVSLFAIANIGDSSALFGPGLTWSVGDAALLTAGAYLAAGPRPELDLPLGLVTRSEFGLYPSTAHLSLQAYF